jgi:hypothetical protein
MSREPVNSLREHLLPGSALASKQDRNVGRRDLCDDAFQALDGRTRAHNEVRVIPHRQPFQPVSRHWNLSLNFP